MNLKSHYQFKKWKWGLNGERLGAIPVRIDKTLRKTADLINTCYYNPSTKTETAYCLVWDIDAHRASAKWKDGEGRVQWHLIHEFLSQKFPDLMKYIFWVGKSTGGKGLAICMAIGPLEIKGETATSQKLANIVQRKILELFNFYEIGADPAALGINRDFPNIFNSDKTLFANLKIFKQIQNKEFREPVLKDIIGYLNTLEELKYIRKGDREGLLYPDIRVEKKLARLFLPFLDAPISYIERNLCTEELLNETKLTQPTLRKLLKKELNFITIEKLNKDNWKILINRPNDELLRRVGDLLENDNGNVSDINKHVLGKISADCLCPPEEVPDGLRNRWIVSVAIILKQNGICKIRASEALERLIKSIPESNQSINCRNYFKIVDSVYRNRCELFGQRKDEFPVWLKLSLCTRSKVDEIANEKKLEKGGYPLSGPYKEIGDSRPIGKAKVSIDRFFKFKGNYYSAPRSFVGGNLEIFKNGNTLIACDIWNRSNFFVHNFEVGKGKYTYLEEHFKGISDFERSYFKNLRDTWSKKGSFCKLVIEKLLPVEENVDSFILRSKGLRKIWIISSLKYQFTNDQFDEAFKASIDCNESFSLLVLKRNLEQLRL